MCTVATWKDNGIAVVTGRNMDWKEDMASKIWILPAGQERKGFKGGKSLDWKSKYGSVVTTCYDMASADGMNEKGLSMHVLWLVESDYGKPKAELPNLLVSLWGQYYVDNFATVAEAIEYTKNNPFNVVTMPMPGGQKASATVHLIINDAEGDMAVFEYIDGQLHIWTGEQYYVATNSPTFDKQLEGLPEYVGFGGRKQIPGDTSAASRFVRTAYYMNQLQKPQSLRMTIAGVISLLRSAAQPYSVPDPTQPNISPTIWRTVCDHTNLAYYFENTKSPYLVWLNLSDFSFNPGSPTLVCDVSSDFDLHGDIKAEFKPAEPSFTTIP
ncbi:MAG TPA: linear amide C-N hydrolase [Candidatus Saccharimonadales bacterium]|nr:linear amide C-N hydrolase [Candidatus Saccharimonadales bacterium]